MIAWLGPFRPDRMAGQVAILVLAAILLFHFSIVVTSDLSDPQRRRPIVDPADVIASAVVALDAAGPERRQDVLARLAQAAPWVNLTVRTASPPGWRRGEGNSDGRRIAARLGDGDLLEPPDSRDRGELYAIALKGGGVLIVDIPEPRRSAHGQSSSGTMDRGHLQMRVWERFAALFLICVLILSLWLSAMVASPLVRLAKEAEKFPDDMDDGDRAPEKGPLEVVELSRAINRMRDRIRSMIASRSHALAAISHDLRTIITRMRLRSEFIEEPGLREKMLKDLRNMEAMLTKNLEFLRDGDAARERQPVDIDSLLLSLADEFNETRQQVVFNGGARRTVLGSLPELRRLFANLIENGARYGKRVVISVRAPSPDAVEIDVADEGPGIPAADRERVLEPFVRGEAARNMNANEGFGLGLSIACVLAERADGNLALLDNDPHGLVARVRLPLAGRPDPDGPAPSPNA